MPQRSDANSALTGRQWGPRLHVIIALVCLCPKDPLDAARKPSRNCTIMRQEEKGFDGSSGSHIMLTAVFHGRRAGSIRKSAGSSSSPRSEIGARCPHQIAVHSMTTSPAAVAIRASTRPLVPCTKRKGKSWGPTHSSISRSEPLIVRQEKPVGAHVCPTRSYMSCHRRRRPSLLGQSMKKGRCQGPVTDLHPRRVPCSSVLV